MIPTFQSRRAFRSAWLVGYNIGKAIVKICSLLDVLLIGVYRIDRARTPVGRALRPIISYKMRSASIVLMLRFKTTD